MLFDIMCREDGGEYMVVEMQRNSQRRFVDRILCYISRLVESQLKKRNVDSCAMRNFT